MWFTCDSGYQFMFRARMCRSLIFDRVGDWDQRTVHSCAKHKLITVIHMYSHVIFIFSHVIHMWFTCTHVWFLLSRMWSTCDFHNSHVIHMWFLYFKLFTCDFHNLLCDSHAIHMWFLWPPHVSYSSVKIWRWDSINRLSWCVLLNQ